MTTEATLAVEPSTVATPEYAAMRMEALALIKQASIECPLTYNTEPGFKPHEWVVRAVMLAMQSADAEKDFVLEQMAEKHVRDEEGMVHATVAAVLEAVAKDNMEMIVADEPDQVSGIDITIPLAEQRTIWDRVTCVPNLTEDKASVVWKYRTK